MSVQGMMALGVEALGRPPRKGSILTWTDKTRYDEAMPTESNGA